MNKVNGGIGSGQRLLALQKRKKIAFPPLDPLGKRPRVGVANQTDHTEVGQEMPGQGMTDESGRTGNGNRSRRSFPHGLIVRKTGRRINWAETRPEWTGTGSHFGVRSPTAEKST
jgi:hypothetical protein